MITKLKYSNSLLPSSISSNLVSNLKKLRKNAKYSQQELAIRSGVSLGSIKRFERTGKISLEALLKIAHVLNRLEDFVNVFRYDDTIDKVKAKFDI